MSRALPLHVMLGKMSAETREAIAKEKLNLADVRDACSKAACQGLNRAIIPLGVANLERTIAAHNLETHFKGCSFEWIEGLGRDRIPYFELRISWSYNNSK